MSRTISVGIDIGTSSVKVIAVERSLESTILTQPKIVGYGNAESKGIRHGYISNIGEVAKSIHAAVAQCEKNSGLKILWKKIKKQKQEDILRQSEDAKLRLREFVFWSPARQVL